MELSQTGEDKGRHSAFELYISLIQNLIINMLNLYIYLLIPQG